MPGVVVEAGAALLAGATVLAGAAVEAGAAVDPGSALDAGVAVLLWAAAGSAPGPAATVAHNSIAVIDRRRIRAEG
jgi:hypothetical protein